MNGSRALLARWEVFLLARPDRHLHRRRRRSSKYFLTDIEHFDRARRRRSRWRSSRLPMTLIIITGEIDISVGSMVGLCAATMAVCLENGLPIEVGDAASASSSASLAGAFNGLHRRLRHAALAGRHHRHAGALSRPRPDHPQGARHQQLSRSGTRKSASARSRARRSRGARSSSSSASSASPSILHRTHWGRALYAIGNNREAARFSGIDVKRTILGVFMASGAMSALAADRAHRLSRERALRHRDRARAAGDHRGRSRRRQHLRRQRHAGGRARWRCSCLPSCRTRSALPA